jgi:PIN domain nuclease of toxin-antitoxin system
MNGTLRPVLLDTCALIWLANGDPLAPDAVARIVEAGLGAGVFVSTVSAWELGMLSRPKPGRGSGLQFLPEPKTWFARVMGGPGIKEAIMTRDIAIDAWWLPGDPPADPGDRLIISTARHFQAPVVTRDSRIIAYAHSGHVGVIEC